VYATDYRYCQILCDENSLNEVCAAFFQFPFEILRHSKELGLHDRRNTYEKEARRARTSTDQVMARSVLSVLETSWNPALTRASRIAFGVSKKFISGRRAQWTGKISGTAINFLGFVSLNQYYDRLANLIWQPFSCFKEVSQIDVIQCHFATFEEI
jgi:hypothetical protein